MALLDARLDRHADAVFRSVVSQPWRVLALSFAVIVLMAAGLSRLEKDPSTDSLIPPDHPSVQIRDKADELFGLRDPMVAAVKARGGPDLFTPEGLALLDTLHARVEAIDGVRADRVSSLASEARIHGEDGFLLVDDFLAVLPETQSEADAVREAVFASRPHVGTLVSQDGAMALVVAELYEDADADAAYRAALEATSDLASSGYDIHVAGEGAVTGYLSASIDADARVLPGVAALVVFAIVFIAFRRFRALPALLLIIAASVAGAIGVMSWLGFKYYVITSALPIILMAIAVADSIHILSGYFERRAADPLRAVEDVVVETLTDLWRPLTLTTLTTMGGFFGIAVASIMPPLAYFGWFAMLGTFLAWAFSLTALPAALTLLKIGPSPMIRAGESGVVAPALTGLALRCARRPGAALAGVAAVGAIALSLASQVQIERNRVDYFNKREPIRAADIAINKAMAGTSYLDILIETDAPDGLLDVDRLQKIVGLQETMEALPEVNKALAVTDVLGELHKATDPGAPMDALRALPADDDAVAQLLLLYEASGDPEDIADEIDAAYQNALVRGYINAHAFSVQRRPVETMLTEVEAAFAGDPGVTATLSGRVNVDYHWMTQLGTSHARSVIVSLLLVFAMAAILFRSVLLGAMAVTPVLLSIVSVYAVMTATGIYIEPGTSMFAAIAIGVGVDFAIHFIDRLKKGVEEEGLTVEEAVTRRFPTSARACLINAAALGVGFSVLMTSALPVLFKFGLLIAVAAATSFIGGLILTCSAYAILNRGAPRRVLQAGAAAAALLALVFAVPAPARADAADAIAAAVNARAEGDRLEREISMTKTAKNGSVQERAAISFRAKDETGERRSLIVYTAPRSIRGTAFMTHDLADAGAGDRRWLFLPSRGSAMRIPDAQRGKYFLGTGFSYEDIKSELKFSEDDYDFAMADAPQDGDGALAWIEISPKSAKVAKQLGYGRVLAGVDLATDVPLDMRFDDPKGRPLKTIRVEDVQQIDGVWTPGAIIVDHLQKNHVTRFDYTSVAYGEGQVFAEFVPENLEESLDW